MEIKGIDVSAHQGKIDWPTVANYGMDFSILRITEKWNVIDGQFENNFAGCMEHGIPVGVYKYSYAMSVAEIKKEADRVIEVLGGRKLQFPIFLDLEYENQRNLSKSTLDTMIKTFWSVVTAAGYKFGIYSNLDWIENVLPDVSKYDIWVARYPANDDGWLQERHGGIRMRNNIFRQLLCKHSYEVISRKKTDRGYIVLKSCKKCGRKKFECL